MGSKLIWVAALLAAAAATAHAKEAPPPPAPAPASASDPEAEPPAEAEAEAEADFEPESERETSPDQAGSGADADADRPAATDAATMPEQKSGDPDEQLGSGVTLGNRHTWIEFHGYARMPLNLETTPREP